MNRTADKYFSSDKLLPDSKKRPDLRAFQLLSASSGVGSAFNAMLTENIADSRSSSARSMRNELLFPFEARAASSQRSA